MSERLGYTVSDGVYLPALAANGLTVSVTSGSASLMAGPPDAESHVLLATIGAGESYEVAGLAPGDVLSIQSDAPFSYSVKPGPVYRPEPQPTERDERAPGDTSRLPAFEGVSQGASVPVTWTCTGVPCPWGTPITGHAIQWLATSRPENQRLGYTASSPIYLPATLANRTVVTLTSGSAAIWAGRSGDISHRMLANVGAGQSHVVSGLADGEVISVQGSAPFAYRLRRARPGETYADDPDVIQGITAWWRCNMPGCTDPDWVGAVIAWPAWSAYESNNRPGTNSRTVYSADGTLLYPYMGPWANGCRITAVSGTTLVIEWQRGADVWRETVLAAGETHTIRLFAPEDNAMIETLDGQTAFSVRLANCDPRPVPK